MKQNNTVPLIEIKKTGIQTFLRIQKAKNKQKS